VELGQQCKFSLVGIDGKDIYDGKDVPLKGQHVPTLGERILVRRCCRYRTGDVNFISVALVQTILIASSVFKLKLKNLTNVHRL